ncbi:thioesterase family protein [Saccharopolyspora sp. ID03-671]|uniref:acyl-CoA thioesterase n=1 Tax=Saccharopolyspora sp. ID03-671 TaxID=3073066 RepID=UPI003244846A
MPFTHVHRVRYHETDAQSYLFNSRYLEIADVAMTEFFRHLGWSYPELNAAGADPSVVSAQLGFHAPAFFDDVIGFEVECAHIGRSSFTLRHSVTRDETDLATISIVYVNVTTHDGKSRPLPETVATALASYATKT